MTDATARPTRVDSRLASAYDQPPVWAELRVHGVSGTPPQTMLASPSLVYPTPVRVAGDDNAGFYRREFQDGRRWDGVEAFSWGGLTSGGPFRALWLLLAPFLFANVAFWAAPVPLGLARDIAQERGDSLDHWWARRASEAIQRLLALALTASLVLGAITAAMDIIGWQYVRGQRADIAWLAFLKWGGFQGANRQLVVSALAPLLLVILLWALGRYTWARLESVKPRPVPPTSVRTPLEDRRMWNGQGPVARLRTVHVSFGIGLVGLALLAPLLLSPGGLDPNSPLYVGPWGWTVPVLGSLLVVLLFGLVVLLLFPFMSDRKRSDKDDSPGVWCAILPWIALILTCLAAAVLIFPGVWDSAYPTGTSGSLPGIVTALEWLFVTQGGLILLLAAATWRLRHAAAVNPRVTVPPEDNGTPANLPPAWFGMAPAVLSTFGWLLGASWSAAVSLYLVKILGGKVVSSAPHLSSLDLTDPDVFIVPAPLVWGAAAAAVVAILGSALVALVVVNYARRQMLDLDTHIDAAYAGAKDLPPNGAASTQRFRQIRSAWLFLGQIPQMAERSIWTVVLLMWVTVVAGVVGYLLKPKLVSSYPIGYRIGAVVLLGILGGTLWLGRRTYADIGTRKKIGILWDVGSFWPRATHPLAPPCYGERAVPDLTRRVEYYCKKSSEVGGADSSRVVLSCHSQGSIIGAATLMQLTFENSEKLSFVTYGSPLRRMHARCFPAYFGPDTLCRIGILIRSGGEAVTTPITASVEERRRWRWRNLYRPTDPVGGPVFMARRVQHIPPQRPPDDVDWNLRDPLYFDERPDNTCYDASSGHSNYPLDPGYAAALANLLDAAPVSGSRGEDGGLSPIGG